jgi:hypothetical protein
VTANRVTFLRAANISPSRHFPESFGIVTDVNPQMQTYALEGLSSDIDQATCDTKQSGSV